jgi:hypothetical protein
MISSLRWRAVSSGSLMRAPVASNGKLRKSIPQRLSESTPSSAAAEWENYVEGDDRSISIRDVARRKCAQLLAATCPTKREGTFEPPEIEFAKSEAVTQESLGAAP